MEDDDLEFKQGEPIFRPFLGKNAARRTRERKKLQILELHAKEVPANLIAEAVGLSVTSVKTTLAKFEGVFKNLERVDDFRKAKANILSAAQLTVLESAFTGDKLDKASFITTLQGYEILNKAERLDLGKSTENHSHSIFGKVSIEKNSEDDWLDVTPRND